jgi:hypothetical protein
MEGSGNDLIYGTTLALAWRDWQKPRKTSAMMASLWAEVWNWDFLQMKQEC